LAGLAVTAYYMAWTQPWLRDVFFGISRAEPIALWWGIQPSAAGIFGAPVALLLMVLVSLATPKPDASAQAVLAGLRRA
ncbi:MAG TPA: cation acetate symporter, partial [Orrella sp.]